MATKDQFRTVAKNVRRELDTAHQAFKTYNVRDLQRMVKDVAGESANVKGDSFAEDLEEALLHEGLLAFPAISDKIVRDDEGFTRIIRSGSLLGGILNALRFPGPGSDQDLAQLLGRIKRPGPTGGSEE